MVFPFRRFSAFALGPLYMEKRLKINVIKKLRKFCGVVILD